ncbi:MAG: hypothetical protein M3Q95_03760, partial [Bacteroidota bacterium]|nr:hypothetical protein [Bacteroidota bacterium]
FFTKNALLKKVGLFSALNGFVFLFVISYSQTKIYWYALPLYPVMAILVALFFYFLYSLFRTFGPGRFLQWLPVLAFLILFGINYRQVMIYVNKPVENKETEIYSLGYVFQKACKGEINLNGIYYCYPKYNAHLYFYTEVLKAAGQVVVLTDRENLLPGNRVLAGSTAVQDYIKSHYNTEVMETWNNNVQLLLIR